MSINEIDTTKALLEMAFDRECEENEEIYEEIYRQFALAETKKKQADLKNFVFIPCVMILITKFCCDMIGIFENYWLSLVFNVLWANFLYQIFSKSKKVKEYDNQVWFWRACELLNNAEKRGAAKFEILRRLGKFSSPYFVRGENEGGNENV